MDIADIVTGSREQDKRKGDKNRHSETRAQDGIFMTARQSL